MKAELLRELFAKGDRTPGGEKSEALDVFEQEMKWRIDNITTVAERDGETPSSNGLKSGFQYAAAIYRDCKKRGVI